MARRKAVGLRQHHGLADGAVLFWEHHARVDIRHAAWAQGAIDELARDPDEVVAYVRQGADAWWSFLDERQSLAGSLIARSRPPDLHGHRA